MAKAKPAPAAPGTAVVVAAKNLPASIKEQLAADTAALANRIQAPGGDKIKLTKKKTFKLPDGTEHPGPLTVVIVDFVSVNKFFDKPYKEGEVTPPACFAVGLEPTSLVPAASSPDVQSTSCATCPNNEFGSKGNGKACANHRVLAVVQGEGDAALDPKAPMWLLEVSPTAIKAFDAYVSTVRTQFNVPPVGVITDVFFDPSSEYQSLRFGNPQPNPNLEMHYGRKAAARERLMSVPDFSKYEKPKKKGK